MINYLTELSVIHIALIAGYWFFLRNEQQYAKMRSYLIASTILALSIPLIKLPKLFFNNKGPINALPVEAISPDIVLPDMDIAPETSMSIWGYDLLIWIYIAISLFFLFKFLGSVLYLIYLERRCSYEKFNELYICKVRNIKGSFTFFNRIFLSDEINKNQQDYFMILKHEKAHVSLGHTYDLMLFELFKVCFWWLPTAWFINKEIRKIHEYQADAYALKSCNIDQYSSILISSTLKSNGLGLASPFHDDLTLKRLKAMKQNAKKMSPWKLGVLCSLFVILFVVFACSEEPGMKTEHIEGQGNTDGPKTEGEVYMVVEEHPRYPGGMDAFYDYLASEIKYPEEAKNGGVEGRVYIQFFVDKDGSLSDVKAIKGIGAGCETEAVRALQNASWFEPGKQRGKPVRVRMAMPITFKLNQDETNEDNSTQGIIVAGEIQTIKAKLKIEVNRANGGWYGTVFDEEGQGLPGANIVVTGTTLGTVSGLDGSFKVNADESRDLYISFVGYESVRIKGN